MTISDIEDALLESAHWLAECAELIQTAPDTMRLGAYKELMQEWQSTLLQISITSGEVIEAKEIGR